MRSGIVCRSGPPGARPDPVPAPRAHPSVRLFLCAFFGLFAALLSGCSKAPTPADPRVLSISQRNEPADLDPATATLPDEFFIIRALGEGLLLPSLDGRSTRPGLAERYDVSPDGLVYTFHLRENLEWSNGDPLTADDLVASYERLLTPATAAPKAHLFFAVKNARAFAAGALSRFSSVGFRAIGSFTLTITLDHPTPRFPSYVATGPWIPVNPRVVAAYGRTWTQPDHYVGNGPYSLAEWRPQQRIVVQKNPRYRDAARIRVAQLHFLRVDSDDTEDRAYRAGQLDVTMKVPTSKLAPYARERPAELHRLPLAETRFLSFNTTRAPLDDPRVRRALSLALDRRQLVDRVVLGGHEPASTFVAPLLLPPPPPSSSSLPSPSSYFPSTARDLLAAAGFPNGKHFPKLELTAWSPSQVTTLEALQAMWRRELGIEVSLAVREAKVHLASLAAGTYDLAFVTTLLDVADPVTVLGDFTTGAPNNFPHWHSAAFDQLIADAGTEPDPARQAALLARAESLLLESAAVSPLYFNVQTWLMSPRVHGWRQDPLWGRDYTALSLDEK